MKVFKHLTKTFSGIIILMLVGSAHADWNLNNDASLLSFISIKKEQVAEIHKFTHLSGSVDNQGNVAILIQLASVDTAVPIRDERMRDMLFQTNVFPQATVTAKVDVGQFAKLTPGQIEKQEIDLTLSLHGQDKALKALVVVVKLEGGRLMVNTMHPIIVNAGDFALAKGVEELRKIADLPAISRAVPVSLSLVFDPQH